MIFSDIPPDISSFTVSVYNKGKRSKDTEVLNTKVYLNELTAGRLPWLLELITKVYLNKLIPVGYHRYYS